MSSDRDRQRARRARQAAGQITVPVVVDEVGWLAALADAGFLASPDEENQRVIGAALSRALDVLIRVNLAELVAVSRRDDG
jgi:hypothetical protein